MGCLLFWMPQMKEDWFGKEEIEGLHKRLETVEAEFSNADEWSSDLL